jgi:hypothetical protein
MRHFDPRYNSPSGKGGPEPYHKAEGAALVAKVMTRAEKVQPVTSHAEGAKWRIEDGNRAFKIDHDAPPK